MYVLVSVKFPSSSNHSKKPSCKPSFWSSCDLCGSVVAILCQICVLQSPKVLILLLCVTVCQTDLGVKSLFYKVY